MVEVWKSQLIISGLNGLAMAVNSYYCFSIGEVDMARVSAVLFLASLAISTYCVYKFIKKRIVKISVWYGIIFVFLPSALLLMGFLSGNLVTIIFGTFLLFAFASSFLTSYVKSDHVVKRALEVVFMLLAFGAVVYGYIATRSLLLGVITLFILAMLFIGFVASYLLPTIRGKRGRPKC